jgi:DNA-binding beta-propeller fold protein YncE
MGRSTAAVAALACAALVAACGDPLVVLGDSPGIMRITLGIGDSIGTRVDTLATRTRLTEPRGLAFDLSAGVLYAGDRGALRQAGGTTTRVARIFAVTSAGRASVLMDAGGCSGTVCMLEPTAFAFAPNGSLIVADQVGHRILRVSTSGLTVLAGTGTAGSTPDGAQANVSAINRPGGVAIGGDGRIYFTEGGASRVRFIAADGTLGTVAGTGERAHSGDGGPATAAALMEPSGLHLHEGTLYVADYAAHVIRRITTDGTISTVAGMPGAAAFSGDGGPATSATLDRPVAVTVTPDGRRLFIADYGNDRVRIVDVESLTISTFAGTGSRSYTGNRRPAGETALFGPSAVEASSNGFLFISDIGHSVVWRTPVTY